ncbi:uncharacterized protein LOC144544904 isoform X2 [Carex rostrata]
MLKKRKEKVQERPSNKRSIWDCFTKVELPDGIKKAKCNNCDKLLSCDSKKHGTSQLWRHFNSCNSTEPSNKDARTTLPSYSSGNRHNHLRNTQQRNTEPSVSQENNLGENHLGYVQQISTELSGNRENQLEYDPQKNRELFVKMVIDNKSMLEHVENPFLQEFARFLQPLYRHVTRRDVEEDCLTFYKKEKAKLKEKITKLTSKVSLSVKRFYIPKDPCFISCVAAHFIDNDFKLFKKIIGFVEYNDPWSIKEIDYEKVLNDWGLCNKVFASSEDSYIGSAEKSSPTFQVKCILNCFRSIALQIYMAINSDIDYLRGMMNDLNEFPEKMCYFNEIAVQHNLARKFEFVLTNKGVLGFYLNILNEACIYKNVLCTFFDMNASWSKVEEVVPLLNKINDALVMLCSHEFPTSNLLLKYVFEITDVLSEASLVLSGCTKDAIEKSLEKLDRYLASCNYILLIASLLDPRFKLRFHKRCIGKFIGKEEDFDKSFCSLYNKYQSESTEIDKFDRLSQIPELKKYLKGRVEEGDVNFDVLGWWKDNELVYPILSRMARDILAIPTSVSFTSETEPMKDILREIFCSTVDEEMSKVLVCCNNWLRATGNSMAGIENIIERRHLDQAFSEHSNRSNSCVYDQIECQELLAKLVISCELPFHFVKSTWFIAWAKNLQPLYTPVDVTYIKTKCLGFYQTERQRFKNIHKKTFVNSAHLERVCFSAHLARGDPTDYVCVTAHFIDNDFNLVRRTIGINIITDWNPLAITAQVQRCIDNWELPKKVLAFTTDQIINIESSKEILDGLTWGAGAIKLHCIINGLFNKLLNFIRNELKTVFESIRKMIKFFVEDPKAMHPINQPAIEPKILQLDDPRRWDTTLNMLSNALAYKDVFDAYKGDNERFPLCENWNEVESAVELMKPIYEAVTILSSSQYPTSNLFLKIVFEIYDALSHVVFYTNNQYDKEKFLDWLREVSDNYLKDCNDVLLVASLLDPRFKSTYLERCYMEHISDRDKIEKFIGNLCIKLKNKHDRGMLELKTYLQEGCVDIRGDDFDILRWWKDKKSKFPILSRIARYILAIPVSSLPSESAFSNRFTWNQDSIFMRFEKLANQLGPRTLEALVCSHNWLSDASSNGKFTQKEAAIDLVEKHIPPSYKFPLRACDIWSISFLKFGLRGRMSEEIVAIGDARLTAEKMQCLIKPIDRWIPNTEDKWIPDEVINCYIGIMNNQESTLRKILILNTLDSRLLESWGSSINQRDKRDKLHQHIIEKGKGFLQNELVFLPIYEQNHWFVGAFNASKKEFQILNSLNLEGATYKETTHKLRLGIQVCIDAALDSQGTLQAWRPKINVLNWPISVISNLPQQEDGCSCGLFALKYMKLWDGSKLATEFTQDDIDLFRKQLVGELIFSDLNEKKDIQNEIKKRKLYTETSIVFQELQEILFTEESDELEESYESEE